MSAHPPHAPADAAACMQVPIFNIMRKFDGSTVTDDIRAGRRKFRITRLPQFLCLHMKRFTKVRLTVPPYTCGRASLLQGAALVPVPAHEGLC